MHVNQKIMYLLKYSWNEIFKHIFYLLLYIFITYIIFIIKNILHYICGIIKLCQVISYVLTYTLCFIYIKYILINKMI